MMTLVTQHDLPTLGEYRDHPDTTPVPIVGNPNTPSNRLPNITPEYMAHLARELISNHGFAENDQIGFWGWSTGIPNRIGGPLPSLAVIDTGNAVRPATGWIFQIAHYTAMVTMWNGGRIYVHDDRR